MLPEGTAENRDLTTSQSVCISSWYLEPRLSHISTRQFNLCRSLYIFVQRVNIKLLEDLASPH